MRIVSNRIQKSDLKLLSFKIIVEVEVKIESFEIILSLPFLLRTLCLESIKSKALMTYETNLCVNPMPGRILPLKL